MRMVVRAAPQPYVHTARQRGLERSGVTRAKRPSDEVPLVILSSVGDVEATYHQLDIGQAVVAVRHVIGREVRL